MTVLRLFHITHSRLIDRISEEGLDPRMGQGKYRSIWLAGMQALPWAIPHVARHHGWSAEEMSLIYLKVSDSFLLRVGRPGVWRVQPKTIIRSHLFLWHTPLTEYLDSVLIGN